MIRKSVKCWKKTIGAAIAFVLLLGTALPASADIIYEPDDPFYQTNMEKCETDYMGACYEICAKDGKADLYKSPEDKTVTATLENGRSFWANTYYTDDNAVTWVFAELGSEAGWISENALFRYYDNQMFEEDYGSEIKNPGEELQDLDFTEYSEIVIYSYPNAQNAFGSLEPNENFGVSRVYTDALGRNWGYCGFYMGRRSFWFSLDAPGATPEVLYQTGALEPDTREKVQGEPVAPEGNAFSGNTMKLLISLVGGTCGIAVVVLILMLIGKSRKKK